MASCKYDPYIDRVNPYAVLNVTQSSQNISNNTSSVRWAVSYTHLSADKHYTVALSNASKVVIAKFKKAGK